MRKEFSFPSKDGKTKIHVIEWIPEGKIHAVLQICHGMCEYIQRYDEFAEFLNQAGYYVVGHDHLGHGASILSEEDYGYFAEPDGNGCVISDIHTLRTMTKEKYPDVPYFLLGHSMGSFLVRQYIYMYGAGLTGVIIMGTGSKPELVLRVGKLVAKIAQVLHNSHYRSQFINNIAFGSYNKFFEPVRTPADWLCKDEAKINEYISDPRSNFIFTVNAYYHLFGGIQKVQKMSNIHQIPKDLPILVTSGTSDPVGDFGKGVQKTFLAYQKAGIKDLQLKMYENDRHEILNETDRDVVYADILKWMDARR